MNYQLLLPTRFNSNMYVYRQFLSEHLTELVSYRLKLDTIPHNLEYQLHFDELLQQTHFKFVSIIKTIDLFETDSFAFGSNTWPSQTATALNMEVYFPIIINNHSK